MIVKSKVTKKNLVHVPDLFRPFIEQHYNSDNVDVHIGANMDILIICANSKELSKDNKERIRILTEIK